MPPAKRRRGLFSADRGVRLLPFVVLGAAVCCAALAAETLPEEDGPAFDGLPTDAAFAAPFPSPSGGLSPEPLSPESPMPFPVADPFLQVALPPSLRPEAARDGQHGQDALAPAETDATAAKTAAAGGVLAAEKQSAAPSSRVAAATRGEEGLSSTERRSPSVRGILAQQPPQQPQNSQNASGESPAAGGQVPSQRGRLAGNARGRKGGSVRFGASYTLSVPPPMERQQPRKPQPPTSRYTARRKGGYGGGSRFSFRALREGALWLGAAQRKAECLLLVAVIVVFLAKYSASRAAFEDGTRLAALSSMQETVQRLTQLLEIGEDIAAGADRQRSLRQVETDAPDPAASIADIMGEVVLILDAHRARAVKEEQEARFAFHVRAPFPSGGPLEFSRASLELAISGFEAAANALRRARPHFLALAAGAEAAAEAARADAQAVIEGISKFALEVGGEKVAHVEAAAQQAAAAASEVREAVARVYRQETKGLASPGDVERAAKQFSEVRVAFRAFVDALARCHAAAGTASRVVDEVSGFCIAREVGRAERASHEAARAAARARQEVEKFADLKAGDKQALEQAEMLAARAAAHVQEVVGAASAEVASERASVVCNVADMCLYAVNKVLSAARSGEHLESPGESFARRVAAVRQAAESVRSQVEKINQRIDGLPKKARERPSVSEAKREARRALVEAKRAMAALEKTGVPETKTGSGAAAPSGGDTLTEAYLEDAQEALAAAEKAASRAAAAVEEQERRSRRESLAQVVNSTHTVVLLEREVDALRLLLEDAVSTAPDSFSAFLTPAASAVRVAADQIRALANKAEALQLRTSREVEPSAAEAAVEEGHGLVQEARAASSLALQKAAEAAAKLRDSVAQVAAEAEQESSAALEEVAVFAPSRAMAELAELSLHSATSVEAYKAFQDVPSASALSVSEATLQLRQLLAKAGPMHAAAAACKAAARTLQHRAMVQRISFTRELVPRAEALMMRLERLGPSLATAQNWESFVDAKQRMAELRAAAAETESAATLADATEAAVKASSAFGELQVAIEETQSRARVYNRVTTRTQRAIAAAEGLAQVNAQQHRTRIAAEKIRLMVGQSPESADFRRLLEDVRQLENEVQRNAAEAMEAAGEITGAAAEAARLVAESPHQLPEGFFEMDAALEQRQNAMLQSVLRTDAVALLMTFYADGVQTFLGAEQEMNLPPLNSARLTTLLNSAEVDSFQDAVVAAASETESPALKDLLQTVRSQAINARAAAESLRVLKASGDSAKFSDIFVTSAVEMAANCAAAILTDCSVKLPVLATEAAEALSTSTAELVEVLDELKELSNIPAVLEMVERLENARLDASIEEDSVSRHVVSSHMPSSIVHAGALLKTSLGVREKAFRVASAASAAAKEGRAFLLGLEIGQAKASASAAHTAAQQAKEMAESANALVPKGFLAIEKALKEIQSAADDAAEAANLAFAEIQRAEGAFSVKGARKAREEAELLLARVEASAAVAAANMRILISRQREVPLLGSLDRYVLEAAAAAREAASAGQTSKRVAEKASESAEVGRLAAEVETLATEAANASRDCSQGAAQIRKADSFPQLLANLQRIMTARNRAQAAATSAKTTLQRLEQTAKSARLSFALEKATRALAQLEAMHTVPQTALAECKAAAEFELAGGDVGVTEFMRGLQGIANDAEQARLQGLEALRSAESAQDPEAAERVAKSIQESLSELTFVFEEAAPLQVAIDFTVDATLNAAREAEKAATATAEIARSINIHAASSVANRASSRIPAARAAAEEAQQLAERAKTRRSLEQSIRDFQAAVRLQRFLISVMSANRAAHQLASALERALRDGLSRENVLSHPDVQSAMRGAGSTEAAALRQEAQRLEEKSAQLMVRAGNLRDSGVTAKAETLSRKIVALAQAAKQNLVQTVVSSDSAQMRVAIGNSAQRLTDARRVLDDLDIIVRGAEKEALKRSSGSAAAPSGQEDDSDALQKSPSSATEESADTTKTAPAPEEKEPPTPKPPSPDDK